jgi:hypothetical protein
MRGDSRNHLDRAGEIGNYLGSVYEGLGTYAKDADLGGSIKKLGTGAGTAFSVIDRAQDGFTIRDGVAVGAGVAGGSFGAYLGAAGGTFFSPVLVLRLAQRQGVFSADSLASMSSTIGVPTSPQISVGTGIAFSPASPKNTWMRFLAARRNGTLLIAK